MTILNPELLSPSDWSELYELSKIWKCAGVFENGKWVYYETQDHRIKKSGPISLPFPNQD